ncbi:hypothetical protein C1H46_033687 [Malus baccata]|uniref:Uncharacterized protein n=1 Tax=Malus baccata TaxID=106549 RepID=A0A540L2T1_MALBA|nr:hypothetical protein C1H46_034637 [Malus baccata]TQD80770.1 hypothetical protein C1H46_033687 [Malus baccata]
MEGSESEAAFNSLNLNPQLFINDVLNVADDLVDDAFDHFHQQASTFLKTKGTERAQDLSRDEPPVDVADSLCQDAVVDTDLDAELDLLRNELTEVGEENAALNREIQSLEGQSASRDRCSALVNATLQQYELNSYHEMFQGFSNAKLEDLQAFIAHMKNIHPIRYDKQNSGIGELQVNLNKSYDTLRFVEPCFGLWFAD